MLLFSPPYTQKFNAVVERPIRTVVEIHASGYALRCTFAKSVAKEDARWYSGRSSVAFQSSKVPLNLDRYHPFGCAVEAVIPKGQQRRFAPKTRRCIHFGYDDNALSYILGSLPGFSMFHTIHAYFNDDDFPCRASSTSWDDHPAYDMSAIDPLGPWLGSADAVPRGHDPGEVQHDLPVAMGDVVVDETPPLPRLPESPIQGVAVQQSDPDPVLPVVPLRRSQRGWHPSGAALQHIAAAGPASGRVAMLGDWDVGDVLGREDEDMVFTTDWARSSFEVDLLHATQEQDVPRSFAQVMKLSPEILILIVMPLP